MKISDKYIPKNKLQRITQKVFSANKIFRTIPVQNKNNLITKRTNNNYISSLTTITPWNNVTDLFPNGQLAHKRAHNPLNNHNTRDIRIEPEHHRFTRRPKLKFKTASDVIFSKNYVAKTLNSQTFHTKHGLSCFTFNICD